MFFLKNGKSKKLKFCYWIFLIIWIGWFFWFCFNYDAFGIWLKIINSAFLTIFAPDIRRIFNR